MIPAKRKLNKAPFKLVSTKGRGWPSNTFSAKVFFYGNDGARFAVVVPKKLERSAVRRNAIKRRFYSVLRPILDRAKQGSLCAFFLKKKINAASMSSLKIELTAVLKKAGVIL